MTFAALEITVLKFPDIFRVSITIRPCHSDSYDCVYPVQIQHDDM